MYEKSLYIHLSHLQRILYTPLNTGYCMALGVLRQNPNHELQVRLAMGEKKTRVISLSLFCTFAQNLGALTFNH